MRGRTAIAVGAASAAILLFAAAPASAAGITYSWNGVAGNFSVAANWAPAAVPGTDDLLVFDHGTSAFNDLPGTVEFRSLTFDSPDGAFALDGSGAFEVNSGITAATSASIDQDISTTAGQTWSTAEGAELRLTGTVFAPTGTLTLAPAVDGVIEFATRLDGLATGAVQKQGDGTVLLSGGGGTILNGFLAARGETRVTGNLTGTDFVVDGGVLSGGGVGPLDGALLTVRLDNGVVSPGIAEDGTDVSAMKIWNGFSANGGEVQIDLDGTSADLIDIYQSATLAGSRLLPFVETPPVVGTQFTILTTDVGVVTGLFESADGPLNDDAEFEWDDHRFRIDYESDAVLLTYLGAVEVPVPPVTPAAPTLPATGHASVVAPTTFAIALLALGVLSLAWAAHRRTGRIE